MPQRRPGGLIAHTTTESTAVLELTPGDQDLLERANECAHAHRSEAGSTSLVQSLEELMDLARHHFRVEEDLMQHMRYPNSRRHAREHRSIFQLIVELLQNLRTGAIAPRLVPTAGLALQLQNHIQGHDEELSRFVHECRAAARLDDEGGADE